MGDQGPIFAPRVRPLAGVLRPSPEHDDTWVVEDVVNSKEVPSFRGNGKVQKWLVKSKGHEEWT